MHYLAILIIMLSCVFANSINAKLYFGADVGINSPVGILSAITFLKGQGYALVHLDINNNNGEGYAGLAYRIPVKIGYVPLGIAFIAGGEKDSSKASFGLYTGFQRNLSKNSMVYVNASLVPDDFKYRKLQKLSIDIGLSFAPFSALGSLLKSGYSTE